MKSTRTPAARVAVRAARILAAATALAVAMALSACGNSDPLAAGGSCAGDGLIVGSANFPESETIAEVYAEVLRANGFSVDTKLGIGSREAYIPALRQCAISVIPEYTGNLLQYLDKNATATSAADVESALGTALGSDLAIGTAAPGQDSDAVVVTRATAQRWNLSTIADLAAHSPEVKFGAPAEFQERAGGLPGLKKNYNLDIAANNFVRIADGGGPATVRALVEGQVTAANIFTTSPAITQNDLVVLGDPKHNFPAQNVVPLLNASKKSDKALAALNAVSAQLTTAELIKLNEAVSGAGKTEPKAAAAAWVTAKGLNKPVG
ncbi:ABC transporter substrate-binding protein [Nocardia implantans]|uniref:ABC transporter substrate-binding protein n=2 Tax=Nocardiaceae TaxID=85025 RepID=A0ABU6B236_9NOCA|nr:MULTISPECIES: ABC transporter substrate-binding protein [unclassified Nocardia]MEA3530318.1 ABC transporter substrate-binding protein [Nocardia sp. CDC192]MEB3513822.1 ABC transporter substrate-binding protein [Nocardia sp. CDC186]